MNRSKLLAYSTAALLLIMVGFVSYFLGGKNTSQNMSIKRITPTQAANAMKEDHFYSDYKTNTLLIYGSVESVSGQSGHTLVNFDTSSTYKATCELSSSSPIPKNGSNVRVLSEGGAALRQTSAVLLRGCLIL
jgi:hypothetical protein